MAASLAEDVLAKRDVLEAVLEKMDAAALCQIKAMCRAWCNPVRCELCNRLWVRLSRREGQPEPAGVDSITDLDVECLNEAGRPWEVVVAGRQLPQLARLHGWGFVVDLQAVREAYPPEAEEEGEEDDDDWMYRQPDYNDDPLGDDTLRSCIQGEGQPPDELLLAAVACAASGTVRGVPVQWVREDDAIDYLDLKKFGICDTGATLLAFMLPAATSVRSLDLAYNCVGHEGASTLAAVLRETQIIHLNMHNNCVGPQGAAAFAEGLKGNTTLKSLGLDNNMLDGIDNLNDQGTFTAEGITKLFEGLKGSCVTWLSVGSNDIGAEGASALAAVLKETQITALNISACNLRCNLGEEGAIALAATLKETQITNLDLAWNGFSDEVKQELQDAAGSGVRIEF